MRALMRRCAVRSRALLGALAIGSALALNPLTARAAGEAIDMPPVQFSFEGMFGTFDRGSLQRGFQVYKEVCSACHAMRQLSYRNLLEIGLSEDFRKAFMPFIEGGSTFCQRVSWPRDQRWAR